MSGKMRQATLLRTACGRTPAKAESIDINRSFATAVRGREAQPPYVTPRLAKWQNGPTPWKGSARFRFALGNLRLLVEHEFLGINQRPEQVFVGDLFVHRVAGNVVEGNLPV